MTLVVTDQPIPLVATGDGVVRIGTTRVTLDTVVEAYREGMTPEGIAEQYPSLRLNDLYSVIGYYLSHTDKVDAYLRQRREQADVVRRENERRFDPVGVRDRLLARKPQE